MADRSKKPHVPRHADLGPPPTQADAFRRALILGPNSITGPSVEKHDEMLAEAGRQRLTIVEYVVRLHDEHMLAGKLPTRSL
jgi:hypothetical protein